MASQENSSSKFYTAFSLVAAIGAAAVAKKALNTSWRAATGKNPPANPADPDVDLWEALLWAAVSGTAVQIARFLFFYRMVGVMAFELTGWRPLLLVFPNTFEYFFIAYELVRLRWDPRRFGTRF